MFNEPLDKSVYDHDKKDFPPEVKKVFAKCDLLIVMGTSLKVSKARNNVFILFLDG